MRSSIKELIKKACPESESNQRHKDFQSSALPTELSGRIRLDDEKVQDSILKNSIMLAWGEFLHISKTATLDRLYEQAVIRLMRSIWRMGLSIQTK